ERATTFQRRPAASSHRLRSQLLIGTCTPSRVASLGGPSILASHRSCPLHRAPGTKESPVCLRLSPSGRRCRSRRRKPPPRGGESGRNEPHPVRSSAAPRRAHH